VLGAQSGTCKSSSTSAVAERRQHPAAQRTLHASKAAHTGHCCASSCCWDLQQPLGPDRQQAFPTERLQRQRQRQQSGAANAWCVPPLPRRVPVEAHVHAGGHLLPHMQQWRLLGLQEAGRRLHHLLAHVQLGAQRLQGGNPATTKRGSGPQMLPGRAGAGSTRALAWQPCPAQPSRGSCTRQLTSACMPAHSHAAGHPEPTHPPTCAPASHRPAPAPAACPAGAAPRPPPRWCCVPGRAGAGSRHRPATASSRPGGRRARRAPPAAHTPPGCDGGGGGAGMRGRRDNRGAGAVVGWQACRLSGRGGDSQVWRGCGRGSSVPHLCGMHVCSTAPRSGLSMPMPNATCAVRPPAWGPLGGGGGALRGSRSCTAESGSGLVRGGHPAHPPWPPPP